MRETGTKGALAMAAKATRGRARAKASRPARAAPAKVRVTFHLREDLAEQCRDAVVRLAGPPLHLTLATLAERALGAELERLRKGHNRGRPFPRRTVDLKGGRPRKRPPGARP